MPPSGASRLSRWRDPLLVLAAGLVLRLAGLARRSVWFDEAVTSFNAHVPWVQLLDAVRQDVHPPLSYALYHLWPLLDAGDFWLRAPSAVLGALAAPLALLWARRIAGEWVGRATGFFVAAAPFQVELAQDARMYGLLLLLVAASLLALDHLLVEANPRWAIWYGALAAAMLYTHYYAALVLGAEGAAALLALRGPHRQGARLALVALAGSALLFLPWMPLLLAQVRDVRGGFWIDPPRLATLWTTFRALAAGTPPDAQLGGTLRAAYLAEVALLVAGGLATWSDARARVALLVLVLPIAAALLVSLLVAPVYALRYVSPAGIAFGFLAARAAGSIRQPWPRTLAALALFFPVVVSLPPLYLDPGYGRADLRGAAAFVRAARAPEEPIVHLGAFTSLPFRYYGVEPPAGELVTDERTELCDAIRTSGHAWLVTAYAPAADDARAAAEAGLLAPAYAGALVSAPPVRFLGVSLLHIDRTC